MVVESLFVNFKRGTVFYYNDGIKGRRPWVVISTDEYNNISNNVLAVPMTTAKDIYSNIFEKYEVQFKNSSNEVYTIDVGCITYIAKNNIQKIKGMLSKAALDGIDLCLSNVLFGTNYRSSSNLNIVKNNDEEIDIEDKINNPSFRRPLKLKSMGVSVIDNANYNKKKLEEKEFVEEHETRKEDDELLKKNQEEMNKFKGLQKELNKIKLECEDLSDMTIDKYNSIVTLKHRPLKEWIVKDIELFVGLTDKYSTNSIKILFDFKKNQDVYAKKYSALKRLSKIISDK